jgi:hypothetical protein
MKFYVGINATANFEGFIEIPDIIQENDYGWYVRKNIHTIKLKLVKRYEFTREDVHFVFAVHKTNDKEAHHE